MLVQQCRTGTRRLDKSRFFVTSGTPSGNGRSTCRAAISTGDGVDLPFVGHALEGVQASVLEDESRAGGEISQRAAGQDLALVGDRTDPGGDVHGNATEVVAPDLD